MVQGSGGSRRVGSLDEVGYMGMSQFHVYNAQSLPEFGTGRNDMYANRHALSQCSHEGLLLRWGGEILRALTVSGARTHCIVTGWQHWHRTKWQYRRHQPPMSTSIPRYGSLCMVFHCSIIYLLKFSSHLLDTHKPSNIPHSSSHLQICRLFNDLRFMEIHMAKLQPTANESSSSVFKADYFQRPEYLAQSPQLAEETCILGDFKRVYEIGPGT